MWNPVGWVQEKFDHQSAVIALKKKYANDCVFDWFQGTEKGVWKTGGICAAMVMDWLRRKYRGKPNYNADKYKSTVKTPGDFSVFAKAADLFRSEGNPKRDRLMTRVLEVQELYRAAIQDGN